MTSCTRRAVFFNFLLRTFEHELIVHLQEHLAFQSGSFQSRRDFEHGDLHDVCRGALDGSVDRLAFLAVLDLDVLLALQGGEVAPAPQQRLDVALLGGQLADAIQIFLDARELLEIGFDKFLCFGQGQVGGSGSGQKRTCHRSGRS